MTKQQNHLLEGALFYAAKGWAVFPVYEILDGGCACGDPECSKPGKHPRVKNGLHDAATDEGQIKAYWKQWPTANIGLRCGKESGLCVVDIDGAIGEDSWTELSQGHAVLTVEGLTGGGADIFCFNILVIRTSSPPLVLGRDSIFVLTAAISSSPHHYI